MWRLRSDLDRVGRRLGDDGICPIVADDACFQRSFISCLNRVPRPTEKYRLRRRHLPNRSARYRPVRLQSVPKSVPTFGALTRCKDLLSAATVLWALLPRGLEFH